MGADEPSCGKRVWGLSARRGPTPKRRTIRNESCSVYDVFCPQWRLSKDHFLVTLAPYATLPPCTSSPSQNHRPALCAGAARLVAGTTLGGSGRDRSGSTHH